MTTADWAFLAMLGVTILYFAFVIFVAIKGAQHVKGHHHSHHE